MNSRRAGSRGEQVEEVAQVCSRPLTARLIAEVVQKPAAGRPTEKRRRALEAEVVVDLGSALCGDGEGDVVAVNEYEHFVIRILVDPVLEPLDEFICIRGRNHIVRPRS